MSVTIKVSHSTFTVTVASPAVFTRVGHGLAAGDIVYFKTTGALPTGLAVGTAYYVIETGLTADAFQVSATLGGSAINTSGTQSGIHTLIVDRTEKIEYDSVRLSRNLTSQADTLKFDVIRTVAADWKPVLFNDIELIEDSETLFGGQIIEMEEEIEGGDVERVRVSSKDYSFDLDRRLVADTYENMTVAAIISDILTNYASGFTDMNVVAPQTVSYIAFKYEYPSKCFQQLADIVGGDWYVDENKDIHFFLKESVSAPFNLTDTNGQYYYDSLRIKKDGKNIKNEIIVRGGKFEGSTITESQEADGEKTTFLYMYGYSNVVVEVDSVAKTVGIDNIHDPADYDCLYNFNEKAVKFRSDNKPTAAQVVDLSGNPHLPVITRSQDGDSQLEYGVFEYKIIDSSINSKEGARDRARAEIRGWADEINEGSFETKSTGLNVGQKINIQSTKRVIDQDYIISKIDSTMTNGREFLHKVTLVTTQTFGMIEFLQKILMAKDKEIIINENEIVDLVGFAPETISITDSAISSVSHNPQTEVIDVSDSSTVQTLDYPVEFCVGDFAPTGFKRAFIIGGSRLG